MGQVACLLGMVLYDTLGGDVPKGVFGWEMGLR